MSGFPLTQNKHNSVWIIVDGLTKSDHFLPVRLDYSLDRLAELYMNEIVRLHGIPLSIVSDHDHSYFQVLERITVNLGYSIKF